ncbi:nuclear transport factor 2 family protein [Dactylosporangium sp. CS-033363]|uniref:nuclear transport factor 2 family protein n=1 Tax=Dactylosporangium sp. CS-033363 TaxID=3239935 RepID=UPI003D911605
MSDENEGRTAGLEARLDALTARVAALEDQLAIARQMATYGPSVDSLSAEVTAGLWAADGRYDAGTWAGMPAGTDGVFHGAEGVRRMVGTEPHQGLVRGGCAHIVSAPRITVDGDTAVSVCYSQLLRHDPGSGEYRVWRTTANRWTWTRTPAGWRVTDRVNRPLDGTEAARALLRDALA